MMRNFLQKSFKSHCDYNQVLTYLLANGALVLIMFVLYLCYEMLGSYFNCLFLALATALALLQLNEQLCEGLKQFIERPGRLRLKQSRVMVFLLEIKNKPTSILDSDFLLLAVLSLFSRKAFVSLLLISFLLLLDFFFRLFAALLRNSLSLEIELSVQQKRGIKRATSLLLTVALVGGGLLCGVMVIWISTKELIVIFKWAQRGISSIVSEESAKLIRNFLLQKIHQQKLEPYLDSLSRLFQHNENNNLKIQFCLSRTSPFSFLGETLDLRLNTLRCWAVNLLEEFSVSTELVFGYLKEISAKLGVGLLKSLAVILSLSYNVLQLSSDILSKALLFTISLYYLLLDLDVNQLIDSLRLKQQTRTLLTEYLVFSTRSIILGPLAISLKHMFFTWVLYDVFSVSSCNFILALLVAFFALFPVYNPIIAVLPPVLFKLYNGQIVNSIALLLIFSKVSQSTFQKWYQRQSGSVSSYFVGLSVFLGIMSFGWMGVLYGPAILGIFKVIKSLIT